MKKSFVVLLKTITTQQIAIANCTTTINFKTKDNGIGSYILERQLPGASTFSNVFSTNALTGAWGIKDYVLTDNLSGQPAGLYTYRIKHVMGSDTSFYYNNITVTNANACSTTATLPVNIYGIKISPNPIGTNNLTIDFGSAILNKPTIVVYNAQGKKINVLNNLGTNRIAHINTSAWANGAYLVEVWNNKQKVFLQQIIK